jgi:hypothetical protein
MAKKRRRKKPPENLYYEIEVMDWEVYYHFGLAPKNLGRGLYWETSSLTLIGNILSPELKNATKAKVDLSADPQMADHWKTKPTILSAKGVGFMEIPRGKAVLKCRCSIPPRLSNNIHVAIASGKIKFVSIYGEKLKWRKGLIFDISLSAECEEDEEND